MFMCFIYTAVQILFTMMKTNAIPSLNNPNIKEGKIYQKIIAIKQGREFKFFLFFLTLTPLKNHLPHFPQKFQSIEKIFNLKKASII